MELLDLCSREKWQALENEVRGRSGLNAAVFNVDGVRLNPSAEWPNRLCPEIKANPKGQSFICATAHMNIANQARQAREAVIEECDAGMVKLVVPIFVEDTFLGAFGGCGRILEDGEVDVFAVNKITGIEEGTIEALTRDLPSISLKKAREMVAYIQEQLQEILAVYHSKEKHAQSK